MTEAIPGWPAPAFPARVSARSGHCRPIAAQLNPNTDDQAVARVLHDVLNVSVGLAQPPADRPEARSPDWNDLARIWAQVSGQPLDALLGEVRLLLARTPSGEPAPIAATLGLGRGIGPLLPADPGRPGDWWRRGITTADGYALWDTGSPADRGDLREIVLVCAADRHEELSAWAWSDGTAALPPFGEYLMHAAKLRFEVRLLDSWETRAETPADQLPALEAELATLVQTAKIARDNLGTAARQDLASAGTDGLFAADRALANWLVDQASLDLEYTRIEVNRVIRARQLNGGRDQGQVASPGQADSPRKDVSVFVVHGRDDLLTLRFHELLRAVGLVPLEWEVLVAGTGSTAPYLGDVVAAAPHRAQATLVLLTPDDVVQLHSELVSKSDPSAEHELSVQSRPNVIFELGLALMAYPTRTVIVEIGNLRPFADLSGRNVIKFDGSPVSIKKVLDRLSQAGCRVNFSGTDWLNTERFADLAAFQRGAGNHAPSGEQ